MQLGKRIKTLRENKGLSQTDLAKKIGVQPSQISSLESEDVAPWQDPIKYQLFADVFNIDARELWQIAQQDRREFKAKEHLKRAETLQPGISKKLTHPIPILSEIPAGNPKDYTDQDYPLGIAEDYYEFKIDDPNAFFLRVEGDCMSPEIDNGDLLLIYPNAKVENGDIVAIKNNKGEKEVRRVTFKSNQVILTPTNPTCPVIVWTKEEEPEVIGRVKEIIRRR